MEQNTTATEEAVGPRRVRRVVTTEQLKALVEAGVSVRLPAVATPDEDVLSYYSPADAQAARTGGSSMRVASVRYVTDEEVQCISVDHPRHLYVTDGFLATHNTSNIVFLKSTDDSMLDTLQKMSGVTHVARRESKSVTQDKERLIKGFNVDGKVTYTTTVKEEPVISYTDMAFISERNSIVFRAGNSPVWNRNETILPMSWRLYQDTIVKPGKEITLQTIPTLSSAVEFDVQQNQPNFMTMLKKRMAQAEKATKAKEIYREAYGYTEFQIETLDPDVYSDEVMSLVDSIAWEEVGKNPDEIEDVLDPDSFDSPDGMFISDDMFLDNDEVTTEVARMEVIEAERNRLRYAGGTISRAMLVGQDNAVNHQLDKVIIGAFQASKNRLQHDDHFQMRGVDLFSREGVAYITRNDETESLRVVNEAASQEGTRAFAEDNVDPSELNELGTWHVHDAFVQFLASLDTWKSLAGGEFDREMMRKMNNA